MNEWDNEPDEWEGEMVYMRRNGSDAWCGYVGVPENHPLFGKNYSDKVHAPSHIINREIDVDKVGAINLFCSSGITEDGLLDVVLCFDVHGGLTYSEDRRPLKDSDGLWWLGFDCSHAGDVSPKYPSSYPGDVYRNFEYVKGECLSLAKQLARWQRGDV